MDIFNSTIARNEVLTGCRPMGNAPDNPKHIAFGVDANFIRPMGVSITSLLLNNPDENLVFHVFVNSINDDDIERLKKLVNLYKTTIHLYFIDKTVFEHLPTTWQYTHATYNRFLLTKVLHGIADNVLYLDADIICNGNIRDLFDVELGDNIVAVAPDRENAIIYQSAKLKLQHGKYFNAGVIYIDINKWHEHDVSGKAVQLLIENYGFYNLLDQDALNVVLDGKAKFMSSKWNFMCNLEKNLKEIPPDTILIHYTARSKPWHRWCIHPLATTFREYAAQSLWKSTPLDEEPRSYREMKMLGKALLFEGDYFKSIYWYLRYAQEKIKVKFH